jgi:hypothetical protein
MSPAQTDLKLAIFLTKEYRKGPPVPPHPEVHQSRENWEAPVLELILGDYA